MFPCIVLGLTSHCINCRVEVFCCSAECSFHDPGRGFLDANTSGLWNPASIWSKCSNSCRVDLGSVVRDTASFTCVWAVDTVVCRCELWISALDSAQIVLSTLFGVPQLLLLGKALVIYLLYGLLVCEVNLCSDTLISTLSSLSIFELVLHSTSDPPQCFHHQIFHFSQLSATLAPSPLQDSTFP